MKRILFLFIILTVFTSCQNQNLEPTEHADLNMLEGVTMQVEEESITSKGLTLLFNNTTNKEFTYGEAFMLEKNVEGKWVQVPVILEEDYGFQDIGYILPANGEAEWPVDWEWLYGKLDAGDYRIVKDMLDVPEAGDYQTFPLAAEFTLE